MIKNLKEINYLQFLGLRNYEEANRIGKDFLYDCANSRFEGGKWSSRPGYTTFGDLLVGGTEDKGLLKYKYHDGTSQSDRFVRYYNGTFYYAVGSTWTAITTSWSSDTETRGVTFDNKLYLVNPVEGFGKISDTTFTAVDATIKGTMIVEWASKIWVSGNSAADDVVRGSESGTVSNPENVEAWDYLGGNAVALKMPETVTGLAKWQDKLYMFMKNGIKVVTGFNDFGTYAQAIVVDYPLSTVGAVAPDCVINVENDVWYLTPELKIRALGESQNYPSVRTQDLSWIIESIREDLNPDQSKASMFYDGQRVFVALTTKDSSENNVVIVYDNISRTWSVDRYRSVKQMVKIDGNIYFSVENSAQIYQDQSGLSDAGSEIAWWGQTGLEDGGRPDLDKRARYLYIRGRKPADLALNVRLYRNDYDTYSEYTVAADSTPAAAGSPTTFGSNVFGYYPFAGSPSTSSDEKEEFNEYISLNQTGRMFGVYIGKLLDGAQVEIDQMVLSYVPLKRKHTYN